MREIRTGTVVIRCNLRDSQLHAEFGADPSVRNRSAIIVPIDLHAAFLVQPVLRLLARAAARYLEYQALLQKKQPQRKHRVQLQQPRA
jgi:hypothetical protein